jgi:hypothetical protein
MYLAIFVRQGWYTAQCTQLVVQQRLSDMPLGKEGATFPIPKKCSSCMSTRELGAIVPETQRLDHILLANIKSGRRV